MNKRNFLYKQPEEGKEYIEAAKIAYQKMSDKEQESISGIVKKLENLNIRGFGAEFSFEVVACIGRLLEEGVAVSNRPVKLVVCGTKKQYNEYLAKNKETDKTAIYTYSSEHLKKYPNSEVVFIGTYWTNPLYASPDLDNFLYNYRKIKREERKLNEHP